jgi:hypothetical protein
VKRAWIATLLLLGPLACRGQFDISQYLADGDTGDGDGDSSDDNESPESGTDATDSESAETETDSETDSNDTEAESPETEAETSPPECEADQLALVDGCFGLRQTFETGMPPSDLALGEFSGDAQIDLLLAGAEFGLVLGNGEGLSNSFLTIQDAAGSRLAVADINDDGISDFAALGATIQLWTGAADGAFAMGGFISMSSVDAAFVNVDGDNDVDLIVSGGSLRILTSEAGSWALSSELSYDGERLATGNFDDDGDIDLVLAQPGSDLLAVFGNDGTGSFATPSIMAFPKARDVATANLDGEEAPELLAIGNNNVLTVFEVSNTLQLTEVESFGVGQEPRELALGDLDGDGLLDAATVNFASDDVSILLGDGGSLTSELRLALPSTSDDPTGIAAADLDNDGRAELVVLAPGSNRVLVLGYIE